MPRCLAGRSICVPPVDDEEVGYATNGPRASYQFRSRLSPSGIDPSPADHEHDDSTVRVVAWRVLDDLDDNRSAEESDEEPIEPVYDAIQVRMSLWKKFRRYIFGGMCLLLCGLAVAVGVSLQPSTSPSSSPSPPPSPSPSSAKVSWYLLSN